MGFHDEYLKRLFYKELTGLPKTAEQALAYDLADKDGTRRQQSGDAETGGNAGMDVSFVLDKGAVLGAFGLCLAVLLGGLALCVFYADSPIRYIGMIAVVIGGLLLLIFSVTLLGHLLLPGLAYCLKQKGFRYGVILACIIGIPGALMSGGGFFSFAIGALLACALYGIYKTRKRGNNDD